MVFFLSQISFFYSIHASLAHTTVRRNWLRGALCTVDRSFGWLLNRTLHHITDTHVCHHLFSRMPFYHAEVISSLFLSSIAVDNPTVRSFVLSQEATEHIKRVIGPYYLKDDTPIVHALWRSYSACQFIEDEGDIVFYKHIK